MGLLKNEYSYKVAPVIMVLEVEFGLCDGRVEVEHSGIGLVETE